MPSAAVRAARGKERGGKLTSGNELVFAGDADASAAQAQSTAVCLVLNYAEPRVAAGTAIFGPSMLVVPVLSKWAANWKSRRTNEQGGDRCPFSYKSMLDNVASMPSFAPADLVERLGALDAAAVAKELTITARDLKRHVQKCKLETMNCETSKMHKWRDGVKTRLNILQKRSALGFLGLRQGASTNEINRTYKRLALEMHPDKGGDQEDFKKLHTMKARLMQTHIAEVEETTAAREKQEIELQDLSAIGKARKLRMDGHQKSIRLWECMKEIHTELPTQIEQHAPTTQLIRALREFSEDFVLREILPLQSGSYAVAELKFQEFVKQGIELLAAGAMVDLPATLSVLALHFTHRLMAKGACSVLQQQCMQLEQALSELPNQVAKFLDTAHDAVLRKEKQDSQAAPQRASKRRTLLRRRIWGIYPQAWKRRRKEEPQAPDDVQATGTRQDMSVMACPDHSRVHHDSRNPDGGTHSERTESSSDSESSDTASSQSTQTCDED